MHRANRDYLRAAQAYEAVLLRAPTNAEAAHELRLLPAARTDDRGRGSAQARTALRPDSAAILYALTQLPELKDETDLLSALDRGQPTTRSGCGKLRTLLTFPAPPCSTDAGVTKKPGRTCCANAREFPATTRPIAGMSPA